MKPQKQMIKLFLLGILAMLLFNFPLLSLSGSKTLLWGFPSQYIYVFGIWILLLILVFFILRTKPDQNQKGAQDE